MAGLILSICLIVGLSTPSVAADGLDMRIAVKCRMHVSKVYWTVMALMSKLIAEQAVGVPQQTISSLHDNLIGTVVIFDLIEEAEKNGKMLTKEALYQINQWCIVYPVQVGTVLGNLASRYPDFVRAFHKPISDIQKQADENTRALLACQLDVE